MNASPARDRTPRLLLAVAVTVAGATVAVAAPLAAVHPIVVPVAGFIIGVVLGKTLLAVIRARRAEPAPARFEYVALPAPAAPAREQWPRRIPLAGLRPLDCAEDDPPAPPPWRRPTDAHSAYPQHRKATFGDGVYESLIDYNIWTPDTPAWRLVAYLPDLHPVPTRIRYGPTPAHVED